MTAAISWHCREYRAFGRLEEHGMHACSSSSAGRCERIQKRKKKATNQTQIISALTASLLHMLWLLYPAN